MLRVISRPTTAPAERSTDLNAEDPTTCSTMVRAGRGPGPRSRGAGRSESDGTSEGVPGVPSWGAGAGAGGAC